MPPHCHWLCLVKYMLTPGLMLFSAETTGQSGGNPSVGWHVEAFWFPLAAGTIGGLVMSVITIFLFLPAFVVSRK